MSMKPSERAKAEYSYEAKYPNELSFVEGDIITIFSKHVPGIDSWWEGEANGKIGIFPSSFVELLPAEEENTSVTDKNFGESRLVLHGPKPRQLIGDGPIQLWQQILQLLVLPPSSELESGLVEWTRKQKYGFRILQPQKLAQLWGKVKNKPAMNSEKLFRGLRYYYGKSMLEKVPGQENTYQFVFDITEILGYDPVDGIPVVTPSKEGSPVDQNASQT